DLAQGPDGPGPVVAVAVLEHADQARDGRQPDAADRGDGLVAGFLVGGAGHRQPVGKRFSLKIFFSHWGRASRHLGTWLPRAYTPTVGRCSGARALPLLDVFPSPGGGAGEAGGKSPEGFGTRVSPPVNGIWAGHRPDHGHERMDKMERGRLELPTSSS